MGICHDHGTITFAHNGYFLFCISARVEKVCFTTHSPATLEALLIWFSDLMIHIFAICGSEQLLHCQVAPTQRQVTLVRAGAPLGAAIAISVPGLEIGPSFSRVGNTRLEVSPTGINMYKPSKWEWSINTL